MKFKEKLATMIQGIFKGNPCKFSIFKSTWSLIFDNQHPVFSCWDQWHQRSCHFHVCHTHVDVREGKILENVTLEVDLNIEIFQELPFNIPWIIIGEFSLNFMLLEPMLLGVREAFFTNNHPLFPMRWSKLKKKSVWCFFQPYVYTFFNSPDFESTNHQVWSLTNQLPVFSCWDQWHWRSSHFHVHIYIMPMYVDVSEGKILKNNTLEVGGIHNSRKQILAIFLPPTYL